jgi:adenylylsulfate kinase-like enzyme
VSAPYEEPSNPEVRIDTTGVSPSESAAFVLERLEQLIGVRA